MFKGACRLDDSVHRTIILLRDFQVKKFRPRFEDYPHHISVVETLFEQDFSPNREKGGDTPDRT